MGTCWEVIPRGSKVRMALLRSPRCWDSHLAALSAGKGPCPSLPWSPAHMGTHPITVQPPLLPTLQRRSLRAKPEDPRQEQRQAKPPGLGGSRKGAVPPARLPGKDPVPPHSQNLEVPGQGWAKGTNSGSSVCPLPRAISGGPGQARGPAGRSLPRASAAATAFSLQTRKQAQRRKGFI